jgi:hypothetical protein
MSRCIVCNKQISDGAYFCNECLRKEVGEPPKQGGLGLLSWLIFSPFRASNFASSWIGDDEKLQWVVEAVDLVTTRFPVVPTEAAVDLFCTSVGLEGEAVREQALLELEIFKAEKNAPLWAPWDIVFQPGIQVLIAIAGLLSLFLLAVSL